MFKCKKALGITLPIVLLFIVFIGTVVSAQIQPFTVFQIDGVSTINVSDSGIANVREEIKFSAQAFIAFRQTYNPISTFVRELKPRASPTQIENLNINLDEANNKLTLTYSLLGAAVYKGNGLWELNIAEPGEKLTFTTKNGNTLVFTHVYGAGEDYRIMETLTVNLPAKAENIRYDEEEGKIYYTLNVNSGTSNVNMLYPGIALIVIGGAIIAMPNMKKRKEHSNSEELFKPATHSPLVTSGIEQSG